MLFFKIKIIAVLFVFFQEFVVILHHIPGWFLSLSKARLIGKKGKNSVIYAFQRCQNLKILLATRPTVFYNYEWPKKGHLLILLSRLAKYSWELRLKIIFEMLWVFVVKILSLYFDFPAICKYYMVFPCRYCIKTP